MNQQFVSVTDARAKLKELYGYRDGGKSRVILVRDSKPEIALVRYDDVVQKEEMSEKEWKKRWDEAMSEGQKAGPRWQKHRELI